MEERRLSKVKEEGPTEIRRKSSVVPLKTCFNDKERTHVLVAPDMMVAKLFLLVGGRR